MSRQVLNPDTDDLMDDFVDAVSGNIVAEQADHDRVDRVRRKVLAQLDDEASQPGVFETIRQSDGEWIEVLPQVHRKMLSTDRQKGTETYLMRLEPGAIIPEHAHEFDEICYVIEGDIAFRDIKLKRGDFHFAHKGSTHGESMTVNGALLLLQSGVADSYDRA